MLGLREGSLLGRLDGWKDTLYSMDDSLLGRLDKWEGRICWLEGSLLGWQLGEDVSVDG